MQPDPHILASIHKQAFAQTRAWSAEEITAMIQQPDHFLITLDHGFALGRIIIDEAELLTIAVLPEAQNRGLGKKLLQRFTDKALELGGRSIFLEVAATNQAARHLYEQTGWEQISRRKNYYRQNNGNTCDAVIMQRILSSA